jgi:hypothetical protein
VKKSTDRNVTQVVINNGLEEIKMVIILFTAGSQHAFKTSRALTSDK